jgi:hypothetical protein
MMIDQAAMLPVRRKRHKWSGEPERLEFETVRTCTVCGLKKITDHGHSPPMVYYLDPVTRERLSVMPECDAME